MGDENENRKFIEELAEENRKFYGTADGRGVLRGFDLIFEHRWLYLFELVQNALDAGAQSMAFRLAEDGNALIFQHDGEHQLDQKAVKALSKVFQSTKGASTVGFMGIGFKSVFGRFREVRISGWGWKFYYKVDQVVGERFGDVQTDLLGAVVPIWDSSIPAPKSGFTTRFEMRQGESSRENLRDDFTHFLPDDDLTPLAILAASGLKCLEMDGRVWDLEIAEDSDGTLEAVAFSGDLNGSWRLFPSCFQPSKGAIARFLEHRRIQPSEDKREQVYAEAARPRRVLGILPLDDDKPAPPDRGRIYATLPTDVTLPFGLHVNADWLLSISRSGLREIEDNAWQRDIVDRIADVLAIFLGWIAHTSSEPATAKAAFSALAPPSHDASRLEALLADDRWLSRFRARLEDAAVLPVWTDEGGALAFAKPGEAILPPLPLAEAFTEQPALRPAVLLKGPVIMDAVLGSSACDLLCQVGLLAEMSSQDLEQAWPDGLARWWKTLADEQEHRRALLIRIWAAVAELTSEDAWKDAELRCVRTVTGQWLPVNQTVFFDEHFPSEREPGGAQVRELLLPFIPKKNRLPDKWIQEVRREAENEIGGMEPFSRTKEWIEHHSKHMSLQEVVEDALRDRASSPTPDWSVLAPLGHWARNRNRPDLIIRVLVEADDGPMGILPDEALLAIPYVEPWQDRLLLFPNMPVVSAAYLEQDPNKRVNAVAWRTFLENVGVKGKLEVRQIVAHVSRREKEKVAEFLGVEDFENDSNSNGYRLLNFDTNATLPEEENASEEVWRTLAAWLEDGHEALEGKGKRKAAWNYRYSFNRLGFRPSKWVVDLTELPWVPCGDGKFRRPQDVLPEPDAGREDAPVAELSSDLLRILDQEGVEFGTAIPDATALRKLAAVGARLDAKGLAQLLQECRKQIDTDDDRRHFEQILRTLTVPFGDGQRAPLGRIVRRAGRQSRGDLGGWIVPLDRIDEPLCDELEHHEFPHKLPDTTTGSQALDYVREVWKRAQSTPEGLANEVRGVLPIAYAYCLEDCDEDASLCVRWRTTLPEAFVFAERQWVGLAGINDIYFDDVSDRRFLPENMRLQTVTGGHLGNSKPVQRRTAERLGLRLLSSSIKMNWRQGKTEPVSKDWSSRFNLICRLLQRVRGSEPAEDSVAEVEDGASLKLICVRDLVLEVSAGSTSAEQVPVNARLHENELTVAGRPVQFGADAAKELLRRFSFGQRAELAADLAGMLGAIDSEEDFGLAVDKFRRSFAPDFKLPATPLDKSDAEEAAASRSGSAGTAKTELDGGKTRRQRPGDRSGSIPSKSGHEESHGTSAVDLQSDRSKPSGGRRESSAGGSFTMERALASSNALAEKLRKSLKGEVVPPDRDDRSGAPAEMDGNTGGVLGDEEYREFVMQYERKAGREPELGSPHQKGWDIRSTNPKTKEVRLIEVKGKGCRWDEDEVVELSRAQVRRAFKAAGEEGEVWYLYVVERQADGGYHVLPLKNPVDVAAKWMLRGASWRFVAEDEVQRDCPS